MMNTAKLSPDPAQIHPIHIHLHGSLANFIAVAMNFGGGSVLVTAVHTAIPLGARLGLPGLILTFYLVTMRASFHNPILAHFPIHSPLSTRLACSQVGISNVESQTSNVEGQKGSVQGFFSRNEQALWSSSYLYRMRWRQIPNESEQITINTPNPQNTGGRRTPGKNSQDTRKNRVHAGGANGDE
jgi:hypothetical protein